MKTANEFNRRAFLKGAALGAAGVGFLRPTSVAAKERFRWKMVTTWAPASPVLQESAELFARLVEQATAGALTIKVFAGGELIPPLGVFDAVSSGTIELGVGAPYYWAGKVSTAGFFSSIPFGMNAQQHHAWIFGGGGLELWQELYKQYDLVPMLFGNTGVQMAGWYRREINSISDIKGLKIRIPGFGGKVLAALGANVVLMPGSEVYTSLERGTIDAAEWVNPFFDERMGLHRAAKYYYYPGWQEPSSAVELFANTKAWESLPRYLQETVSAVAGYVHTTSFSKLESENAPALHRLLTQHHVQLKRLSDEVLKELKRVSHDVVGDLGNSNAMARKVYSSYESFRKQMLPWTEISEGAMAAAYRV